MGRSVQRPKINVNNQYIVGYTGDLKKHTEIPPDAATKGETEKIDEKYTWFQNHVNCMSKWSKALKQG